MEAFKRRQDGAQGTTLAGTNSTNAYAQQQNSAALGTGNKRQRVGQGTPGGGEQAVVDFVPKLFPVCLLLSENIAGALIGKAGATVREYERSTGARILVHRNTLGPHEMLAAKHAAADTAGAPSNCVDVEKVVAIGANKEEELQAGVSRIVNLIATHATHNGRTMALMLVPHRSVGGIVGQRGKTIEELSVRSQAQIRVMPGMAVPSGDRAVWVSGQKEEYVVLALQLLQQHLQQMLGNGRLGQADVEFLVSLASVPQPKALRGGKGAGPLGAPMPGAMTVGPPGVLPGGFYGPSGADGWGGASGAPQGLGAGAPAAPGMGSCRFVASVESCGGLSCTSVLCFVIPQRLAPWIVGPQGAHVRAIRDDTGAQLQVVDEILGFTAEDARRATRQLRGGPRGGSAVSEGAENVDRFCMVSGGVQALCAAILRLGVPLHEKLQLLRQPLRLLIPARFATCLIGSKGSVIREMQHSSGASIEVTKGPPGSEWLAGPTPVDQHRIVSIEGPLAPRLVALALIFQRILGVEYADLARGGAPFLCIPSLVEDLQQQGHDIAQVRIPPAGRMPTTMQQQPPYSGEEAGGGYYEGAPAAGAPANWGEPAPDPMAGGAPGWGGDEACWGAPKEGLPAYEQMESCFRDFCSRYLPPQELGVSMERQTIKLLLSHAQGEALLRREAPNPRFGSSPPPNTLDRISELTGCHVRCFVTQEPVAQGALGLPPQQQQMVLVFTGPPIANSLAVLLTQARLVEA